MLYPRRVLCRHCSMPVPPDDPACEHCGGHTPGVRTGEEQARYAALEAALRGSAERAADAAIEAEEREEARRGRPGRLN